MRPYTGSTFEFQLKDYKYILYNNILLSLDRLGSIGTSLGLDCECADRQKAISHDIRTQIGLVITNYE